MMGGGVIELTAKNYHKNILASLQLLRLQGLLSDVTVHVDYQGDVQVFQAHRVMLAASSGYFREHLLAPDSATQGKLLLSNIHVNYFSKFLEFVYTGKVEVSKDKIADVLAAALRLDCKDLAEVCGEAMTVGILENSTKKLSAKKVEDSGHLRGAKRKKQPQSSHSENEVQDKTSKVKDKVARKKRQINTLKLCFGGRKVLQRRVSLKRADVKDENKLTDEDNDDGAQAGSPSKISESKEEEPNLKEPAFQSDEWTCQEDEQSNDTENDLAEEEVSGGGGGGEGEGSFTSSKAQFQCNKCQRTFHYERSYLKHISTYHGVKADVIYRCLTCQQTFANQSNLKIHEKHVHSTERLFTCDRCEKTFKRKKDVVRHQRQVHERSNLQYVCSDCGKSLSSKTALVLHQRRHTGLRPFECPDCHAKFTQNSALKMHRRIHTGEKPFACDSCEARFTQKHMLAYHKRSHTGEKPFMCEACGKSFASKEYLRHHSNIHTGSKPYKCEQCGRCFAQRNSLHQHLKIHTGERPYSCKDCEKQFTQLNALQRHQRIHTGEKPYMCGLCGRTFTDKSTLRRHTMIHDSDAPWKTYLVVLEGNVEDKKAKLPTKGKVEKAAGGREKNTATRKSHAAASAHDGAAEASVADDGREAVDSSGKGLTDSILVPAGPVPLPPEWTTHGAITLVSHGNSGEITVIHTDMTPGTQIQPIVTTEDAETRVISLEASAIPLPFSIPISIAHPIPLSAEVSTSSLSVPTLSLPVSDAASASISETPTISTSSVLEAAASHILAPVSESDVAPQMDILHSDIQCVTVGNEKGPSPSPRQQMDDSAAEPRNDP